MKWQDNIKELSLKNDHCKLKVKFLDSSVFLTEIIILDTVPCDIDKEPCNYRQLKDGRFAVLMNFAIPNRFIYDAVKCKNEDIRAALKLWFEQMFKQIEAA